MRIKKKEDPDVTFECPNCGLLLTDNDLTLIWFCLEAEKDPTFLEHPEIRPLVDRLRVILAKHTEEHVQP